jgi:lysine 2,3-aminomutase
VREPGSWQDELARSFSTEKALGGLLDLGAREIEGIRGAGSVYRWRVTPYYASLMDPADPDCPIRRQAIPSIEELADEAGTPDPLGEEAGTVAPNLIRLYPDRVAWCVTAACPVYCRFCFRRRLVAGGSGDYSAEALAQGLDYIRATPEIRDVLVTGGDPLMLGDEVIEDLLAKLRAIPHVEIIRIGTRAPATLPQRVTPELCEVLRRFHPLWINTHFNHPRELTPLAAAACARLADAGIPLGNQSVLLKRINDDEPTTRRLLHGLVRMRVRPYYLFQCHLSRGCAHFRTPVETGMRIVDSLRGSTTGFAVPAFIVDTPFGKVPLQRETVVKREEDAVYLRAHDGRVWREPNLRET